MDGKFKLAVLLSGRGSNFKSLLSYIESKSLNIEVVVVLSDKPDATGLTFAKSRNIPIKIVQRKPKERTNSEFNAEIADTLAPFKPDLIVLAGFMRILTGELINRFPGKIINIHPSLLPAFKGLDAQAQAFNAGVKFSGCTVHLVVEELDSGPIIAQAVVGRKTDDSVEELSARILEQEHIILPAVVEAIANQSVQISWSEENNSYLIFEAEQNQSMRVMRSIG